MASKKGEMEYHWQTAPLDLVVEHWVEAYKPRTKGEKIVEHGTTWWIDTSKGMLVVRLLVEKP